MEQGVVGLREWLLPKGVSRRGRHPGIFLKLVAIFVVSHIEIYKTEVNLAYCGLPGIMSKPEPLWQRVQLDMLIMSLPLKAREPLWHIAQLFDGATLCCWAAMFVTWRPCGAPARTE